MLEPMIVLILVALFALQSRGTARVASFFGPVMTVWFVTIAAAGLTHIADDPGVLAALNPAHGIRFLSSHGYIALVTLGVVFLAVTGAEALSADLGSFRTEANPDRVAILRLSRPRHQLFRSGRARACGNKLPS
jgi:KUP system potassium uptake protein